MPDDARRARGYQPRFASPEQDALLDRILERARACGDGAVGVFDLDGCLFDNRPRIIQIWREVASRTGLTALCKVQPEHFLDWDHARTFRNAGLTEDEIHEVLPEAEPAFFRHFFEGEYCINDHPMPGAARLVWECYRAGLAIAYLTGRHEEMREGTEQSLVRCGFPYRRPRTRLVMKPDVSTDDLSFKEEALREIDTLGRPCFLVDNEPGNVNIFRRVYPDALVAWVETDHSPRPIHPHPEIPTLRGFLRTSDPAAEVGEGTGPAGSARS